MINLANVIRKWRFALEMDQKAAAANIGIEIKALRALELKGVLDGQSVGKVIAWLFSDRPAAAGEAAEPDAESQLSLSEQAAESQADANG